MMSLNVLVGTLSLLPPPSLSPPASLHLSISVVIVRKPGSGRKEERQRRKKKKKKEEEDENKEVKQLYANQDFPEYYTASFHLRQQVHFTLSFSASPHIIQERGNVNSSSKQVLM